jgi:hypothetical protein
VTALELATARRDEILQLLSTLPTSTSVSEGGRSMNYDRSGLLQELEAMNKQIALLSGPFVITSTAQP